jgi:hypothetical protein
VKRLFLTITLAFIGGSQLHASGVIACSGDAGAVNSCYTSHLASFTTQLDWAIVGSPDGALYTGVWTANNVLSSGLDVSVSGQGLDINEGIRLAHNLGKVFYINQWTAPNVPPEPPSYYHPGHFQATSNPNADIAIIKADPTIHLLGLALNGSTPLTNEGLLLNFSSGFDNLGFFAAGQNNPDYSLTIQIFDGLGGTGTSLFSNTFNFTGSGGTCLGMSAGPPVGCNDAPFIFASAFGNNARSVILSSNDDRGFYITNLHINDGSAANQPVPEPATVIVSGCGIGLLLLSRRLRRRAS